MSKRLPIDDSRAPGEARAERDRRDLHPALEPALPLRFGEHDRNGGRSGIAVTLDVVKELLLWEPELLGDVLVDPQVRLVDLNLTVFVPYTTDFFGFKYFCICSKYK